jgi:4-alpha-glucanotransferase
MSGIVLPVSSLPGPYGIGTLGAHARKWIDFLHESGQQVWQILPLSPTGYGDSPYQSCSSMAGNPYLIDLDTLAAEGLLTQEEIDACDFGSDIDYVDYGLIYQNRLPLLRKAYLRGKDNAEVLSFVKGQESWLPDYALFMALKEHYGMVQFSLWPDKDVIARDKTALRKALEDHAEAVRFHAFIQYIFYKQWRDLKAYARKRGVKIMGDMPIYVAEDSAEVWAHPELFQLSGPAKPARVAGVPPDFYSATGQLWGNPLYDWAYHEKTGYKWWLSRMEQARFFYDILRIDHFRAFYNYWSVPAGAETALTGRWVNGPRLPLVEKLKMSVPYGFLVAEDLGDLGGNVRAFFRQTGLPGMKVLVYAFDPEADSEFLPHNAPRNSVSYTSTHDSSTFTDWYRNEASGGEREFAARYLRLREEEGIHWGAVCSVWNSPSRLAMAPFQDILGLSQDARINVPSTLGGNNWRWRVREDALNESVSSRLLEVTKTYRRFKKPPKEEKLPVSADKSPKEGKPPEPKETETPKDTSSRD